MRRLLFGLMYFCSILGFLVAVWMFSKWELINGAFVLILSILLMPCVSTRLLRKTWKFRWQFIVLWFGFLLLASIDYPATPIELPRKSSRSVSVETTPGVTPSDRKIEPAEIVLTVTNIVTPSLAPSPSVAPTLTPTPVPVKEEPFLMVTCLDVGQGDASLFQFHCEDGTDRYMMIDGGDRGTSSFVVARLKKLGVGRLDVIVATHYDADHTFGLIGCIEALADEHTTVYCPDYVADTYTYTSFQNHLIDGGMRVVHPDVGDSFSFGDCSVMVVGPNGISAIENNNSIALYITYEGVSFLFTGDAESAEEMDIVDSGLVSTVDVYHVGHHGSYSASSQYLLNAIKPRYSIISVGEGNDYEHPHNVTLKRLQECGTTVMRTDLNGEIVFKVTAEDRLTISKEKD